MWERCSSAAKVERWAWACERASARLVVVGVGQVFGELERPLERAGEGGNGAFGYG